MDVVDNNYEDISSTAIVTSYPRTFTDISYEKEIYNWLNNHCKEKVTLNKMLAPEIEARYKLINKILEKSNIKQVLEIAAGYSSRGLIFANKDYNYIEMDLDKVTKNKVKIIKEIDGKLPLQLNIISGNALKINDVKQCESYLDESKPVAIINEGLLRYLTFDEKMIVAENVYTILNKYGGIWITCDVTPKKFIKLQNNVMPDLNKELNKVTARNNINDRFEDINHVKEFFNKLDMEVTEIHKFSEMKQDLYSINHYNITDDNINQLLDDAIVAVIKIKGSKL